MRGGSGSPAKFESEPHIPSLEIYCHSNTSLGPTSRLETLAHSKEIWHVPSSRPIYNFGWDTLNQGIKVKTLSQPEIVFLIFDAAPGPANYLFYI